MTRRALDMPFGAQVTDGGVRFRLWAPAAKQVDLVFHQEKTERKMNPAPGGWFEITSNEAGPGTRYKYRIDGHLLVPDPASRFQPEDAEGPSEVVDARAFEWTDGAWQGRPWAEAVLYELHVGTFSPEGNYKGVEKKLAYLKDIGVTAIELMPLADFVGARNWGYDGVLPFAPDSRYGRPDDLKALVQAAHRLGLMMFLDVVYNHFGPKGNYLHAYAPQFFTERHHTPWGAAINFDAPGSDVVRSFFAHNARYWLEEYGFDGLRFDAVHAIMDDSKLHVLEEISREVRLNQPHPKHLVLENDANQARFIGEGKYDAQWNDDSHHAFHVLATGESDGYYADFAGRPAEHLARALAEGFAWQGEHSDFRGHPRGEKSSHLAPRGFVDFLQNHDQVGNRAFGERLLVLSGDRAMKALSAILLLAPAVPMLFMGEEWGCRQPFLFFCDFEGELADAVRNGRRSEFARFAAFRDAKARERIPDPLDEATFRASALDWGAQDAGWLEHTRSLLEVRRRVIVPLAAGPGQYRMLAERAFEVSWAFPGGSLVLAANLDDKNIEMRMPNVNTVWSNGRPGEAWGVHWSTRS